MPSLRELSEYHRPASLDEAIQLVRRPHIRTVALAGGTHLVPSARRDVEAVVDLNGLNLAYIKSTEQGITLGATTTLQTIMEDQNIRDYADGVLVKSIVDTASLNTRNAASIAGSIVGGAGNSPLITVLLALDARLNVRGDQSQTISLDEWVHDDKSLIVEILLPRLSINTRAAYEKVARTPADLPIVCVAVRAAIENGSIDEARIAIGGVAARPIVFVERGKSIEQAIQSVVQSIDPPTDYFASAEYRRAMVDRLATRAFRSLSSSH